MHSQRYLSLAMAGALAAFVQTGETQTTRPAAPNAQATLQMQQLASERTSLQAQVETLKKELSDSGKERDALKTGQAAQERRAQDATVALQRGNAQRQSVEQQLTQSKAQMQELVGKFRETAQALRTSETESAAAKRTLAMRDHELKTCVDRNLALYQISEDVLTRLEHQGFWSRAEQAEPFTRIKRTQLDNLIDDYRGRAQDQRMPQLAPGAAGASLPPAAPVPTATPPQPTQGDVQPPNPR